MGDSRIVLTIVAFLAGAVLAWIVRGITMSTDMPVSAAAEAGGPPCHAKASIANCVTIPINWAAKVVGEPRDHKGNGPIDMGPVDPNPVWETLRFAPASGSHGGDDNDLGPTGCHYWVEYNNTPYRLHC